LVIPGINDWEADEVIETVASFGRGTPLHITSYFPAHKLSSPPPDKELIEEIWRKAKRALDYVYVGNLPAHPGQNTYCPECGNAVIKRKGDRVLRFALNGRKCWHCGFEIEMRGLPGTYGKLYQGFLG
ncbi:MAG: pyruvate formate lyase-activating protein, partial [Thermoplasmata archaeon]